MLKKIIIFMIIGIILSSCSRVEEKKEKNNISGKDNICEDSYKVGIIDKNNLLLKGVIISDETKNVSSPMSGIVSYLNCNPGSKVFANTLVAKIKPDFNNPNVVNLNIQKSSLLSQKANIESLKSTTIANFDNQINSTKEQISIVQNNIDLTKKSSNLSKKDLEKQIETLEKTLVSLKENLNLLQRAKKEALEKIEISEKSLFINIKNISSDNLLKVDEVFGITKDNEDKNDRYEDFLSAKNRKLLLVVKSDFTKLNDSFANIDDFDYKQVSEFLSGMLVLDQNARDAIKESIVNVNFPQTQIDAFYSMFLNYTNSLSEIKNSWDSLENSKVSVETNYDTQISNLENQIVTTQNNLDNLKTNKIGSVDTGLELQLSQLESQLKTLKTNLDNLEASKKSQIINFDNQLLQFSQQIASLDSSLASRNVYAGVNGIVKQKLTSVGNNIGLGLPLCQIIPNAKSIKIKIYSPIELNIGDKLIFELNGEKYEIIIENALVYKDAITQNYVYESNYLDKNYFKEGEIITLKFNNDKKAEKLTLKNTNLLIPVSYITNKIDGNFIKVKTATGVIERKVELGDINGSMVEIKGGLGKITEICK